MRRSRWSEAAAFAVALLAAAPARAVPRFAARYGAPCSLCHVNPTGGGMRNAFGRNVFESRELGLLPFSPFDPHVGEKLYLGGDFRLAVLHQPDRSETPPPAQTLLVTTPTETTVFPMQADLYVVGTPAPSVTFYSDVGAGGSYEIFALLQAAGLYLKGGMFTPPYGTKMPNHTASVRQPIGFDPRGKDAGVEVGATLGPFTLQSAILNGEQGGSPIDRVEGIAVCTRGELRLRLGPARGVVGGSYYRAAGEIGAPTADAAPEKTTEWRAGPFLWASLGRFAYVGEAAFRRLPERGTFVAYHELTMILVRGLDVGGTYEYLDRDVDVAREPADVIHRVGALVEAFPLPMSEINLIWRRYFARPGQPEDGQQELIAFLHLFL